MAKDAAGSGARRRPRGLGGVFVALALVGANGCSSVMTAGMREQAPANGVVALGGWKALGMTRLIAESYVPGTPQRVRLARMRCKQAETAEISIRYDPRALAAHERARACALLTSTADHVAREIGLTQVRYEAVLVPASASYAWRRSSLAPFTRLTLGFAVPWSPDASWTHANLVDVFAHEAVHLRALRTGHALPDEEEAAYYAGLCAQLDVLGELRERGLPGTPVANAGEAGERSSRVAYDVRRAVFPLLHEGRLPTDSPRADELRARCATRLAPLSPPEQ
ncbi:hypothetical protein ACFOED_09475 [Vulcaniibacterium thermophilum]|uniref:Uncharacterized protein n=1 Tax=Vulcaniibacterium thermophilum TaxID=1169913 RepID=A0A918Z619_9GAMM|nr:hypothetical protein GCM10007167_21390 [Vulcaniibacterium thermophilum]